MTRVHGLGLCSLFLALSSAAAASARVWTDSTGKYTLEANLVAFDDNMVILQRADHELGGVAIDKLSEKDREYLKSKEAGEEASKVTGKTQLWTLANGLKVPGKVVDYARKEVTLQRRRGKIYANDRQFENLPEIYQKMLPQIVKHFEPISPLDKSGLEMWLVKQKGGPRTFTLEGVMLELENGDVYGVPFFFFSPEDLKVMQPGWDEWEAAHKVEQESQKREQHSMMLQAAAAARQQDAQVQREIAMMQLNLQAVQAGLTSLWEVTLYPTRPNMGPPLWVVMPGRNSGVAAEQAMAANPGYAVGPIRRVSY
jgi:hypothetical protein